MSGTAGHGYPPAWLHRHSTRCHCGTLVLRVHLVGDEPGDPTGPALAVLDPLAAGTPVVVGADTACDLDDCGCGRPYARLGRTPFLPVTGALHHCRRLTLAAVRPDERDETPLCLTDPQHRCGIRDYWAKHQCQGPVCELLRAEHFYTRDLRRKETRRQAGSATPPAHRHSTH